MTCTTVPKGMSSARSALAPARKPPTISGFPACMPCHGRLAAPTSSSHPRQANTGEGQVESAPSPIRNTESVPMSVFLKYGFPVLRILGELSLGLLLLLGTPAALYTLILDSPDLGELNTSVLRIALAMALGLGLWVDALAVGKQLRTGVPA